MNIEYKTHTHTHRFGDGLSGAGSSLHHAETLCNNRLSNIHLYSPYTDNKQHLQMAYIT